MRPRRGTGASVGRRESARERDGPGAAARAEARVSFTRWRGERGAASLLVLAVGLALVFAGVAGAAVGTARVGRHQARTAADLGALAGAVHAVDGEAAACAVAARYVAANDGRLTGCDVDGLEIVVHAEVAVTPLPGVTRHAAAAARAGPVYSW